jgi:hypothetical protein
MTNDVLEGCPGVHSVPISKNCSVFLLLIGREKGTQRIQEDDRTGRLYTAYVKGWLVYGDSLLACCELYEYLSPLANYLYLQLTLFCGT